jgi:hypothetical protein
LEPGTLLIGLELFIFGIIAYYIRMVGYHRIYSALGGINFGISAFSALLAYLIISNSTMVSLTRNTQLLFFFIAVFVCIVFLGAGLLNITREHE